MWVYVDTYVGIVYSMLCKGVHAMKVHGGSRGIAPLIFYRITR